MAIAFAWSRTASLSASVWSFAKSSPRSPATRFSSASVTQPEFSAPWFAYSSSAYCQSFPCSPAAITWSRAFSESGPMNASPANRSFSFPGRTYSSTIPGSPSSW